MRVLASYSIKGGVGKTATAVALAYLSSRAGARTLIWDLDPQAAASYFFRVALKRRRRAARALGGEGTAQSLVRGTDHEGLYLVPAGESLRKLDLVLARAKHPARQLARVLAPLAGRYDHVYLDCPPGLTLAAEAVFGAADLLVVPTIPTVLSLRTLEQLMAFLERAAAGQSAGATARGPGVAPFFSMADARRRLHREVVAGKVRAPVRMLRTTIPYASAVERSALARAPLPALSPGHPVSRAYVALWRELAAELDQIPVRIG